MGVKKDPVGKESKLRGQTRIQIERNKTPYPHITVINCEERTTRDWVYPKIVTKYGGISHFFERCDSATLTGVRSWTFPNGMICSIRLIGAEFRNCPQPFKLECLTNLSWFLLREICKKTDDFGLMRLKSSKSHAF